MGSGGECPVVCFKMCVKYVQFVCCLYDTVILSPLLNACKSSALRLFFQILTKNGEVYGSDFGDIGNGVAAGLS